MAEGMCRCEQCCPAAPAPTWTRAWALTCEARLILSWHFERRRPYLDKIMRQRGAAAHAKLEAEIRRQWRSGR